MGGKFEVLCLFRMTAQTFGSYFQGVRVFGKFYQILMLWNLFQMAINTDLRPFVLIFMALNTALVVCRFKTETIRKLRGKRLLVTGTATHQFGIGAVGDIGSGALVVANGAVSRTRSMLAMIEAHRSIAIFEFFYDRTVEDKVGLTDVLDRHSPLLKTLGTTQQAFLMHLFDLRYTFECTLLRLLLSGWLRAQNDCAPEQHSQDTETGTST